MTDRDSTSPEIGPANAGNTSGSAASVGVRTRTRGRTWLFRAVASVLVPALLLGLMEAGLRLFGYGYTPSYFTRIDGQTAWAGNPKFGWTYFPPAISRMPTPFVIADPKPAGTYRIFVLGSSAALGFPDPSLSFARILETMLRDAFPSARFEVINTAMVAINSHVVLPIARDCARHEPDLFIVYEGNNEVVGPFGPATVFAGFSGSRTLIATQLSLARSRVGQLAKSLIGRASGSAKSVEWKGMGFFLENRVSVDDPRLDDVRNHFAANLGEICDVAKAAGAGVVLCTVGVNLRDCAPFASEHPAGWQGASVRPEWEAAHREGVSAQALGDFPRAIRAYRAALKLDERYAETHFRLAQCLLASGQSNEAAAAFSQARDCDALRFRTDSKLNAAIREVAMAKGVALVDVEDRFTKSLTSPPVASAPSEGSTGAAIPGNELLLEHVHMTFAGNYEIARALFVKIAPLLPQGVTGGNHPPPPDLQRCAARLAYNDWDELGISRSIVSLLSRPPFTNQVNHAESLAAAERRVAGLSTAATADNLDKMKSQCEAALAMAPEDPYLHHKLAAINGRLAMARRQVGLLNDSIAELDAVSRVWPFDPGIWLEKSTVLIQCGRLDEAAGLCERVIASDRSDNGGRAEAYYNLGIIRQKSNRTDDAIAAFEEAVKRSPSMAKAHGNLGLLLAGQKRWDGAIEHDKRVIELEPLDFRGPLNLGVAYFQAGRLPEAITYLNNAVALAPTSADAHASLGAAHFRAGDRTAARAACEKALTLDRTNALAAQTLHLMQSR